MALWKDPSVKDTAQGDAQAASVEPAARPVERPAPVAVPAPAPEARRPAPAGAAKESLIAAESSRAPTSRGRSMRPR